MDLKGLNVVISASIKEFSDSMNQVESRMGKLGKVATTAGKVGAVALGAIVTALGAVATATATVGVKFNATQEQSMVAWTTLLGGAKEAKNMMEQITHFAKVTPFDVENVDMMAKYMHNAGLEGKDLFDQLMRNSDVASAFAISGAEAKEFTRQMSQVQQAGVAMTEDLNILQDRGIPIFKELGKVMGVPVADVKKLASEGKITSEVYMEAFNNIAKSVEGASEAQSKTFNGMISAMGDNLNVLAGLLAKPLFDKLKQGLEYVLPLVENLIDILKGGGGVTDILKALGIPQSAIDFIVTAFTTIKGVIQGVFDWYKTYVTSLFSGEGNIGASFVRIFGVVRDIALPILQDAIAFIKGLLGQLKAFWNENGAQIIQAVKNMWNIIASIFEAIAPVLKFIVKMIWNSVKGVIQGALNVIMGLIKVFAGLFTGDFGKMWEGVKQLFKGAIEFVWNLMNLMFIGRIITAVKSFAKLAVNLFKDFGVSTGIVFKNIWNSVVNTIKGFVSGAQGTFNSFKQMGLNIFQSFKGTIEIIWQAIQQAILRVATKIYTGIQTAFTNIWNTAKTIFNNVKTAITNPIESAKKTVLGIIDTIKGAFSKMRITIPKPKLPKISVSMKKGVMGIPYPDFDIGWYAKGGLFDGPSVIGVGEKGTEAVVPLQGHRMKPFAETIAKMMPNGNGGGGNLIVEVAQLVVREEADIHRVAQQLHVIKQRELRQGGRA